MADFDFTQLKGRMAQVGKGGHVELSDLERNALITNAIDGGSVDPEEVQELIDESLEGYYNKFEVDSELNTKSDKADTYTKSEVNALIPSVDNDIIIGALPSSGVPNTIYRVPGTDSYTDYAWDGTQFVPLGTFTGNGDIDATPTENSTNPVQSGGVYETLSQGLQISTFDYSQFTSEQPNITLSTPLSLSQVGDFIELDVNPNGKIGNSNNQLLRRTAAYQNPRLFYSASNTINISYDLVSPTSYQGNLVAYDRRQTIRVEFDSVSDSNNVFKMYVDGNLVTTTNVATSKSVYFDMIGYESPMKLYSLKYKSGGVAGEYTKFSEIQGATGITDNYITQSAGGLTKLNEDIAELRADIAELQNHAIGEDMYYSFTKVSGLYNCESHFSVYQKIKGTIYAKFNIAKYVTSTQPTWPQNYWRVERGDIVTLINGSETTIQSQAFVAGENEFVLSWTDGTDYNYASGYTGGFHYGESPQWVEFYADDRLLSTDEDIAITPCKSFFYKEYSDIYQKVAGTVAAHHYKRTDFKEGGYDTLNEVQFTQALGYYAYFGIVCVGRYLSQYAMPENTPTATDMGTGTPTQTQQFKSNNHRIHYEGNGFATDVWSELLYGDEDDKNELVVYNSTSYNKYYRRTQDITGSTLNRSGGITKVRVYPLQ